MDRLGLDTNCAGYLFEAMQSTYNPLCDGDNNLRPERVALLQIFLYLNNLHEVPSMRDELNALREESIRKNQLFHVMVNLGKTGNLDQSLISNLIDSFLPHHNYRVDCHILAEADVAELDFLLTCDNKFIKRLSGKSRVSLLRPTQYLQKLNLSKGLKPRIIPDPRNHFSLVNWWRI